jgi:cytochrome b
MTPPKRTAIRVWDLPVRIVHWVLVLLLAFQVLSAWRGGAWMQWHAYSGYCILFVLAFRVAWGFNGTRYARFSSFVAGPRAVLGMLPRMFRREPLPYAGHNPLAGWMVLALLAALALQLATGLFANDGAGFEGPFARLVTADTSASITIFHRANARLVIVLSALHVGAALWHLFFKRDDLISAMVHGRKSLAFEAPETGPGRPRALLVSLAVALILVYVVLGAAL